MKQKNFEETNLVLTSFCGFSAVDNLVGHFARLFITAMLIIVELFFHLSFFVCCFFLFFALEYIV